MTAADATQRGLRIVLGAVLVASALLVVIVEVAG